MEYSDPIKVPMLTAASADETISTPVALNNTINHSHAVQFEEAVASGVVLIETAPTRNYAGTWEILLTADASVQKLHTLDGYPGPGFFVRHRIGTVLAGGTVTSWMRRRMHN